MERRNKILICLSALVVCLAVLFLNAVDSPKYQQSDFPSASAIQKADEAGKININKATAEELTALYGIGEAKAKRIIKYREENKRILSADELMNIDGISENIINKISDKITF